MTIPLLKVFMPAGVFPALQSVLLSGWVGEGAQVAQFERELAPWVGSDQTLALNSGTSALHLALRLAGVGPGDEVISTPMTCIATNSPILALGGTVVWADIDPWTGNISAQDVARKITARTKAIITVHWAGRPGDLAALATLAESRSLAIIEDACLALGATYQDRPIGSISDFTCFSFQATKQITTVDGGLLTCRSPQAFERGRRLRWYGVERRQAGAWHWDQDIVEHGYKFHMNDVAAVLGREQLKHLPSILAAHRAHAATYDEALRGCALIQPLRLQAGADGAHWVYTVRVREREAFARHMTQAGVGVSRVFVRNDHYQMFAASRTALPGVDEFDAEQISIPCGWWLTDRDAAHVVDTLRAFRT